MATTKNKVVTEEKVEKKETNTSSDIKEILAFMESMKKEMDQLKKENESLKEEIDNKSTVVNNVVETKPERKYIKICHLQECLGGLTTHIELSTTVRDLKRIGDVMNISLGEFEELAGKYSKFFENGVLAVDSSCMDIAEEYNLPIFDKETKSHYNSKLLSQTGDMTNEELKDFFNSLSFQAQSHFLSYWLNKCYLKDRKYYDREKLVMLDKLSDTDVFANLIFELNTEESRKRKTNPIKTEVM